MVYLNYSLGDVGDGDLVEKIADLWVCSELFDVMQVLRERSFRTKSKDNVQLKKKKSRFKISTTEWSKGSSTL